MLTFEPVVLYSNVISKFPTVFLNKFKTQNTIDDLSAFEGEGCLGYKRKNTTNDYYLISPSFIHYRYLIAMIYCYFQ